MKYNEMFFGTEIGCVRSCRVCIFMEQP